MSVVLTLAVGVAVGCVPDRDCLGVGSLDTIDVEFLEPYEEGGRFEYESMFTPLLFGQLTGESPTCGAIDGFGEGAEVELEIGMFVSGSDSTCNVYHATTPDGPELSSARPLAGNEVGFVFAGGGGQTTLEAGCFGTWAFALGGLDERELMAEPIEGALPARLMARAFRTGNAAGCSGLPEGVTGPYTCADVWVARVTDAR